MFRENLYKLLLVDDDHIIRSIYQETFNKTIFDIMVASDGKQALQLAKQKKFDAILTDIDMPEMSGIELTKTIRTSNTLNNTTMIVGITASRESIQQQALHAGMDKIFAKPAQPSEIEKYLQEAFVYHSHQPINQEISRCLF